MSVMWKPGYKIRRSNRILSIVERQNYNLLQIAGEACYLLKRQARVNAPFQVASRRVSTLTEMASAGSYTIDPDTGMPRYCLWSRATDLTSEYPDIQTATVTVQASGGTSVWHPAVDKYSFLPTQNEYSFDVIQDQLDSSGNRMTDAVYVVFNTPPFDLYNTAIFTYGPINPLVHAQSEQPVRDDEPNYRHSLFGFEQWLSATPRIRSRFKPNAFLLAFPGIKTDFSITDGGLLQEVRGDYWTTPPPYSPEVVEHDVVIREANGQRYQVTDYTPIYIENILVSQHFNMVALDPRSSIYGVTYETG